MKVAFGMKAHSGWAALVVLGERDGDLVVTDRCRVELADEAWAKQPYHAAENLKPDAARATVERGIESARRNALREMRSAVERARERGEAPAACAVIVGEPMPEWSTEEILAVHFRMHKAEGVLFREALVLAAPACGLEPIPVPEKALAKNPLAGRTAALGRSVVPPWARDQKEAALAALIALTGGRRWPGRS